MPRGRKAFQGLRKVMRRKTSINRENWMLSDFRLDTLEPKYRKGIARTISTQTLNAMKITNPKMRKEVHYLVQLYYSPRGEENYYLGLGVLKGHLQERFPEFKEIFDRMREQAEIRFARLMEQEAKKN